MHSVLRRIWYVLPFRLRMLGGRLFDAPGGELMPPRSLRLLVGPGDFHAQGRTTVSLLESHAGLTRSADFLDVGCGVGRTAIALTSFLEPSAHYSGFDIVPEFIRWCDENITSRHGNYTFALVDAANSEYNRDGSSDAAAVRFPYDDASFDFVYAGSLFTHLLGPAAANYVAEGARVLRKGGTWAATFFLINDESRRAIDDGSARMPLRHAIEGGRILDRHNPEADVGHNEELVRGWFDAAGMTVEKVAYGSWCRAEGAQYQDMIVARKRA